MKIALKLVGVMLMLFSAGALTAQLPSDIIMTESGQVDDTKPPLDDIVEKQTIVEVLVG